MASESTCALGARWPPWSCVFWCGPLLDATVTIGVDSDRRRERELPPAGGYAIVPLLLG
jgi:hypothetical protein